MVAVSALLRIANARRTNPKCRGSVDEAFFELQILSRFTDVYASNPEFLADTYLAADQDVDRTRMQATPDGFFKHQRIVSHAAAEMAATALNCPCKRAAHRSDFIMAGFSRTLLLLPRLN